MARAAPKRKKKEEKFEFAVFMKTLWKEVDRAVETGRDFTLPQVQEEYKKLALEAREEPREKEQLMKELKPRKDLRTMVATKAGEKDRILPLHVKPKAAEAAIYLAEMFENAEKPTDLKFEKWVKRKEVAA